MKTKSLSMADLPSEAQVNILGAVIARLSMRLLRAGIDPETVLTQDAPSRDERAQMGATANFLIGQVALDYLASDEGGTA